MCSAILRIALASSLVSESTAIAPLEAVHLPDHLDGRNGTNRAAAAQISAQTDIDALKSGWRAFSIRAPHSTVIVRKLSVRCQDDRRNAGNLSAQRTRILLVHKSFLQDLRWPPAGSRNEQNGRERDPRWRPSPALLRRRANASRWSS